MKRSPTRGTITRSIRSHTRRGQLRNPPTGYASLPITYFCFIVIANPACWLRQGVKQSPARGTITGSIRSHKRRGQLRNPTHRPRQPRCDDYFYRFVIQLRAFLRKCYPSQRRINHVLFIPSYLEPRFLGVCWKCLTYFPMRAISIKISLLPRVKRRLTKRITSKTSKYACSLILNND